MSDFGFDLNVDVPTPTISVSTGPSAGAAPAPAAAPPDTPAPVRQILNPGVFAVVPPRTPILSAAALAAAASVASPSKKRTIGAFVIGGVLAVGAATALAFKVFSKRAG